MLKVINLVSLIAAPIMVAQKKLTPVTIGIIAAGIVVVVLLVLHSRRGAPEVEAQKK